MKKFGFTLTEVLISIGVVGIVAAITAPLLSGLMPDQDKIAVLKAYKIINDVNEEIKSDKTVWHETPNLDAGGWRHLDAAYAEQFSKHVSVIDTTLPKNWNSASVSFDTIDGTSWTFEDGTAAANITVDFGDTKKGRCTYSASCTNPGKFSFFVEADNLNIAPNDPLTAAYLANKQKLNDKSKDFKTASQDTTQYKKP